MFFVYSLNVKGCKGRVLFSRNPNVFLVKNEEGLKVTKMIFLFLHVKVMFDRHLASIISKQVNTHKTNAISH